MISLETKFSVSHTRFALQRMFRGEGCLHKNLTSEPMITWGISMPTPGFALCHGNRMRKRSEGTADRYNASLGFSPSRWASWGYRFGSPLYQPYSWIPPPGYVKICTFLYFGAGIKQINKYTNKEDHKNSILGLCYLNLYVWITHKINRQASRKNLPRPSVWPGSTQTVCQCDLVFSIA